MIFTANTLHSADGLDTSLTSPNVVFRVDQKRVNILAHITRTYLLLHFEWAGDTFLRDQSKHQINIHCTQNLLCRLYCRRGSNSEPMTRKYAKYVYVYTFKDESMCLWKISLQSKYAFWNALFSKISGFLGWRDVHFSFRVSYFIFVKVSTNSNFRVKYVLHRTISSSKLLNAWNIKLLLKINLPIRRLCTKWEHKSAHNWGVFISLPHLSATSNCLFIVFLSL